MLYPIKHLPENLMILLIAIVIFIPPLFSSTDETDDFISAFFSNDSNSFIIPDINDVYGVAFRDINNDNYPDLYLVCFRNLNRLLINNNIDNIFEDFTIQSQLGGNLMPRGTKNLEIGTNILDFDNDNDPDIILTGWGVSTNFFINSGNLTFKSIKQNLNIKKQMDANGCFVSDINKDGYLDIFITDEHYSNKMLINDRKGGFVDSTEWCGLEYNGVSQSAAFCDIDNDNDDDLYVCNWFAPDLFYKNTGKGKFILQDLPIEVCQKPIKSNGVSFGDIDNDGDFDLFVTNRRGRNFLYINNSSAGDSNWIFINSTIASGFTEENVSYGSVMSDFNNDGWLDIFVTNVGPNCFYLNQSGSIFKKVYEDTLSGNENKPGYSTGVAVSDFDLDGDIDLFVANKDTFSLLYTNPINNKKSVSFTIRGVKSNRDGIGCRVEIYHTGYINTRDKLLGSAYVSGGGGYMSLNDPVIHFGLDTLSLIDAKIIFPSGKIIKLKKIRTGCRMTIFEYSWLPRTSIFLYHKTIRMISRFDFWIKLLLSLLFVIFTFIFIKIGTERYNWESSLMSIYLVCLFISIIITILFLQYTGYLKIAAAVDVLTIGFISVVLFNSERLFKLRKIREKYRSVLIELSGRIISIRDNDSLISKVIDNITKNTEFNTTCIFIYNTDKKKFCHGKSAGRKITLPQINKNITKSDFLSLSGTRLIILKNEFNEYHVPDLLIDFDILIMIKRNENFYGFMALSTDQKIPPLTNEDKSLYLTIANQMAIALENNEYIHKSNEMIRKLTEAEVQKRYLKELENKNKQLNEKNIKLQNLYDELKNTESQLIHSEKMASLGQLVAGISHELNNPIGYIYGNIKQFKTYIKQIEDYISNKDNETNKHNITKILPDIKNLIEDTVKGSHIVKELIDNLRTFSHLDRAEKSVFDIHKGITSCLVILRPQLKNRIKVHKKFLSSGLVECNPGQLNQVFLNILANAAQAITDKGNIWISTRDQKNLLIIDIKDDGKGIPDKIIAKIFDPFFTTKDIGMGIGLGLSISCSIVEKHGGEISVKSKIKEGSKFCITLPSPRSE